jgi:polar amino acid transport system substrate-binding protein
MVSAAKLLHSKHSLALSMLMAMLPGTTWACEKSLRWDDDPPFSMAHENGHIAGISVDFNRAVLARLGCQARLVKLPWARALKELELGRLDILPGAFKRPEREVYAYFSGAVLKPSRNVLFMHRDALARWPISRLLDLQDTQFRLGAQIDVSYGPDYRQLMSREDFASRVSFSPSRHNLWRMIDRGRIDGIIADEQSAFFEINQLGLGDTIKPTAVVVSTGSAEVAFSKKSTLPSFVQNYARAMQELVADGSYERIVQRYSTGR